MKVVGMAFAVHASLGEDAECFSVIYHKDDTRSTAFEVLNENDYETDAWNEIYFDEPIEITEDNDGIQYGYFFTNNPDEYQHYIGETSTVNDGYCFLAYADMGKGYKWYLIASEEEPYTPCILLILQKPSGETAIIGVNGEEVSSPEQYFSVNGTRLAAPQKGVNIVKMSDGKIKKVLVK